MRSPDEGSRQCQDTLRRYQQAIATDPLDGRPCRGRWLRSRVAQLSPAAEFHDLSPIVHAMRLVKSAGEIELMRQSGRLTALACMEAMRSTRPGVYEFQLGAAADYLFQANGAQGAGYRPIIASGSNIPMMHYWRNNAPLRSGDLVLYDYAPDYNYYTSDIGRMWPVDGTYSPPQRELYGFVLEHHRVLLSLVRPGRTKDEILDEAAEQLRPIVEGRNWSKPHYKSAALRLLESKRPLSHGVGMAVHEAAAWDGRPVEPGLVFAVDPELLVPEERLYVRVEDTVRVTEDGAENLTASCPREMDDVERLMKEPGMLQCHPAIYENAGR
jgi:Xaa-Pro aminopeptidase